MEILIGFNLFIMIVAVFASARFGALARLKGYAAQKAKVYPYFIGGGALFFNILGQTLLSFASRDMMTLLFCCWSGFVVLAMIAILMKAYKNMKTAPDAANLRPKE